MVARNIDLTLAGKLRFRFPDTTFTGPRIDDAVNVCVSHSFRQMAGV